MFKVFFFIAPLLFPLITVAQDLKFELLTKWESLTPELPISLYGGHAFDNQLFKIGDFDKDGINDVGLSVAVDADFTASGISEDSLYILTIDKTGSVKNIYPIVPGVPGFKYSSQLSTFGFGGFGRSLVNMGDMDGNGTDDFLISSPKEVYGEINGAFFILFMNSNGSVKDFHILDNSELGETAQNDQLLGFSMTSIGDLDNDGINEVAVNTNFQPYSNEDLPNISFISGFYVLYFNPDGSLKKTNLNTFIPFYEDSLVDFPTGAPGMHAMKNAGDLDSNGVNDILIDNMPDGIYIFYLDNKGNAIDLGHISGKDPKIKAAGNYYGVTLSSVVDIDNDGNDEIISTYTTVISNDSSESMIPGIIYYNDSLSISNFELIDPYKIEGLDSFPIGTWKVWPSKVMSLGDINDDGYPEMAIHIMHNNGNKWGQDAIVYIVSIKPADCDETECVWPGDANNDGVANSKDLLNVGRGFNKASSRNKRILPVNTWFAQEANEWGELIKDVDMKFADCDGNGIINTDDVSPIQQNYNLAHKKSNTIEFDENGPLLRIVPAQQNLSPDDTAQFHIFLGEQIKNAKNVFGINMTLRPTSLSLFEDTIYVDYTNSWIGDVDSNAIHLEHQLTDGISFAIARTDHKNTTNYGKIASIKIPLINNPIEKFTLEVTELNIESHEGGILLVNDIIADSISIVDSTTINSHANGISTVNSYPNPTSDRVYFNLKDEIKHITIYSSVGYLIKSEPVNARSFNIDLSSLTNGTYFISLHGKDKDYKSTITVRK
jgi:hypothetical protein